MGFDFIKVPFFSPHSSTRFKNTDQADDLFAYILNFSMSGKFERF